MRLGQGTISIPADVEEVMFGGALTRVLLHAVAAPEIKIRCETCRATAAARRRQQAIVFPSPIDPADAVIVAD